MKCTKANDTQSFEADPGTNPCWNVNSTAYSTPNGVGSTFVDNFLLQTSNPYGIHLILASSVELRRSSIFVINQQNWQRNSVGVQSTAYFGQEWSYMSKSFPSPSAHSAVELSFEVSDQAFSLVIPVTDTTPVPRSQPQESYSSWPPEWERAKALSSFC